MACLQHFLDLPPETSLNFDHHIEQAKLGHLSKQAQRGDQCQRLDFSKHKVAVFGGIKNCADCSLSEHARNKCANFAV